MTPLTCLEAFLSFSRAACIWMAPPDDGWDFLCMVHIVFLSHGPLALPIPCLYRSLRTYLLAFSCPSLLALSDRSLRTIPCPTDDNQTISSPVCVITTDGLIDILLSTCRTSVFMMWPRHDLYTPSCANSTEGQAKCLERAARDGDVLAFGPPTAHRTDLDLVHGPLPKVHPHGPVSPPVVFPGDGRGEPCLESSGGEDGGVRERRAVLCAGSAVNGV